MPNLQNKNRINLESHENSVTQGYLSNLSFCSTRSRFFEFYKTVTNVQIVKVT